MKHVPNIYHLGIHLSYRCNLHCAHCHNLIPQAPSTETMKIDRIEWLVDESVKLKHKWEWLVLEGGEPTLHPGLEGICSLLSSYKKWSNPDVKLFIATNGHGAAVQSGIKMAESFGFKSECSGKDGRVLWDGHVPICNSPLDCGESWSLGCHQTSRCGVAFNNHGFWSCSPLACAARVFGYQPQATRLEDVTVENMEKGLLLHCQHCGYSRGDGVLENISPNPSAPMTKTWLDALGKYKA